jgi:hypothetical protein
MSNEHATRETMSIEETTVSNMWEIAAIVEVLEHNGKPYGLNKLIRSPSRKGGNYHEHH